MEEQSPAAGAPSGTVGGTRPVAEDAHFAAESPRPGAEGSRPAVEDSRPDAEGSRPGADSPRPDAEAPVAEVRGAASSAPKVRKTRAERPAPSPSKKARRRHPARAAIIAALVAVVLISGAAMGGFSWLRWFSENDAADLQGTWYLAGTATPIEITEDRIQLTDDVSYRYTLNDGDKTFELSFGNLNGGGRYRFSLDRNQVALVDGDFSGADTLGDDFGWTLRALVEAAQGRVLPPEEKAAKGVTLLSRTPTGSPVRPEASDVADKPEASDVPEKPESDAVPEKTDGRA
ncbi:hypothetical protein VJ923_11660 [Adlercreutzia sp. R25]|uniref:DUF5640 domain-containing protein n=1 Tax=Adlercreutzia shanghongiae TaxID=3111773 RepID=A0ABU6IWC8_9ACTN|nr:MULTISPECIES: hypothetical protein [unclassified Adlercreutzia]MEC4273813.1 hypothetical protein [Adlercreutzia sp. R25]MEC4294131.1 hypothetical protein [Adlercreutzia sp. R22]